MKVINQSIILLSALIAMPVFSDSGSGSKRESPLAPFQQLIDQAKYDEAIRKLDAALAKKPDDPDLINLVAYSHRQLRHYEIALNYYLQALRIEPEHRGANEYLGELYLHTGQIEKAEERLEVLDDACFFGCREYDRLEEAIETYRRQNPSSG